MRAPFLLDPIDPHFATIQMRSRREPSNYLGALYGLTGETRFMAEDVALLLIVDMLFDDLGRGRVSGKPEIGNTPATVQETWRQRILANEQQREGILELVRQGWNTHGISTALAGLKMVWAEVA